MASEKKKVFEQIQKGFQEDTIAGAKLKKDLPLLATNLNNPKHLEFLFNEYRKEGLIPDKLGKYTINNAKDLTLYLQRYLNSNWDRINKEDPTTIGDKKFKKAYFNKARQEILNDMVQKQAMSKLTEAQKANPEVLEQISKMRWKGLPIKVSSSGEFKFDRRYFHDKVSQRVIDYAEGIEPGLGKKWAKEMRASWNAIGKKNQALKASSGISMDIGHFIPSKLDGPNVGFNAEQELSKLNRSKGSTPFTADRNLARQLGIPENWMQAFTDWHLREQGLDPNALPKGYELKGTQVVKAAEGVSDPNLEIAKNLRKYELDQQPVPQGKLQPDFEVINGKVVKSTKPTTKGILQGIVRDGKAIFETTVNNKAVKQVIDTGSKVVGAVPTPIKKVVKNAPIIGSVDDLALLATPFTSKEVSKEQKKVDMTKSIAGGLGLASLKFPAAWLPSATMWALGEMKQQQLDRKNKKAQDLELWYMQKYVQATDEEGNPVNATLKADTRRTGRFRR